MATKYLVRFGTDRYVKAFVRSRDLPSLQYSPNEYTSLRSEACAMSYNVAMSVARKCKGSVVAA